MTPRPPRPPRRLLLSFLLLVLLASWVADPVLAKTNAADVSALNVMYASLNSPPQLTGWSSSGGDPCDDDWKGIQCSDSSVAEIDISGLGLSGTLGYQLSNLNAVTHFDVSKNNLKGDIPYQLPPNAEHINLAENAFTGGIPYSISQISDLTYLSLAHNQLSGQLSEMFGSLQNLLTLDLSFNGFSGNLPQSFGSMKSLESLNIQNNQFSGPLDALTDLSLKDLNIQNNQFSGWIPEKLKHIGDLKIDGNSWSSGSAPKGMTEAESHDGGLSGGGLTGGAIAGIVLAALVVILILLALVKRRPSSSLHYIDGETHYVDEQLSKNKSVSPLVGNEFGGLKESSSSIDVKALELSSSFGIKHPPSDQLKSFNDNDFASKYNSRRSTDSTSLTAYSLADLQAATGSFSTNRLLGEGTIGRVYKAKFDDRKVLAVKKIDTVNLSGGKSYDIMAAVLNISKLRHPNIAKLLGYCLEPGNSLLVYEFQRNGSLHGFLHLSDDYSKPLTWDTRVKIALGTARAVEYLHEVCSPSFLHKNIKSSNILLDAELNPHLSDCGLADFYEDTSENLGAGYNAPECVKPSAYTMKSDVYSFGVVMLELLTGRKPFDSSKPRMEQSLARWATAQLHDIDALSHMADPALRGLYPPKSLSRFADVIALCIQSEPEFRPAMSEVVQSLVRCVQRTSFSKILGGELSASRRSDDSDSTYF